MAGMQVNPTTPAAGASSWQPEAVSKSEEKEDTALTIYEMMKDAREKAQATREKFESVKPKPRYGDAPIEAYSRLARAKRPAEVTAAAGYARRQIAQLKSAKRTDPDNAQRIQAAIKQLQKAVNRAGKKHRELERESAAKARQEKLAQEDKTREAQRQRMELRRKKAARVIRESGYVREAEIDNRMQAHMASTRMELQKQAQSLTAALQPPAETVARQYGETAAATPEVPAGGELDIQA